MSSGLILSIPNRVVDLPVGFRPTALVFKLCNNVKDVEHEVPLTFDRVLTGSHWVSIAGRASLAPSPSCLLVQQ